MCAQPHQMLISKNDISCRSTAARLRESYLMFEEELLQLLYMLYQRHEDQDLLLEGDTLSHLAGRLFTLFPLAACRSMALAGDRIVTEFDGQQKVAGAPYKSSAHPCAMASRCD